MVSQAGSELEQRLLDRAAGAHAATAQMAETLFEFAASDEWQGYGIRSFGHWCDINLGLRSREATRIATAAERLGELPLLRQAFGEGSVSPEKVLLVSDVATAASDERFTTMAMLSSVAQLTRICSAYRKIHRPDDADAAEQRQARRRVAVQSVDDDLVRITTVLEKDEAAIVLAAIDRRVEARWREEREADYEQRPTELGARRADALVELANDAMEVGPDPIVAGDHIEARVNVDLDLLAGLREDGICSVDGFGSVPLSVVRTICCDARTTAVYERMAGMFNLGRTQRTANRAQRRCLRKRDGGCRYPGCPARRVVQVHHAVPWEDEGPTDIDNLLELCPRHHRLFHAGVFQIEVCGAGDFIFRRPNGRVIAPPPLKAKPCAGPPPPGDPRAQAFGERLDLGLTLDALIYI